MPDDARGSSGGGLAALVRLLIVLVLGGAVALPFVGQSGSRSIGESRPASSGSSATSQKDQKPDGDAHTDALMVLGEFAGLDVSDLALAKIPDAARAEVPVECAGQTPSGWTELENKRFRLVCAAFRSRGISVDFVIATAPDPINSNASWTFDPIVGAIDRAAAASGFLMDRFYIPDWSPEPDAQGDGVRLRSRHERWPGVVLFRSAKYTDPTPDRRVLVTSLVFETPTAGIHQEAFAEAVRIASTWPMPAQPDVLVLGPVFSGSLVSLRNAVEAFPSSSFRIVTGSATSRNNVAIRREEHPRVTFSATVQPDDEVVDKLVDYLSSTAGDFGSGRMALLVEGDTSYGSELKAKSAVSALKSWPPDTLILPFPLQISRLRSAAIVQSQPASTSNPSRLLGLSLGQSGAPTDQLPSLTPVTTSAAVELELSQVLDVITRDHIATVGLLATDTRDKLFLAQQLARRSATVRLFTIESDLFYAHPDYSQYVRGMIVASSYPLFAQSQRWEENDAPASQQFQTTMAEGIYNAMVMLLNYNGAGEPLPNRPPPRPLDYRLPGTSEQQPPIWISVVGNDAIWPVAWFGAKGSDYIHPLAATPPQPKLLAYVSSWAVFGVGALWAIVALHVFVYTCRDRLLEWEADTLPFFKFFAPHGFGRRRPYLFVAFTVLAVAWGYTCALMAMSVLFLEPSRLGSVPDWIGGSLSVALLAGLLWCTIDLGRGVWTGARSRVAGKGFRKVAREPQYPLMIVALGSALFAGGFGFVYLFSIFSNRTHFIYYFERATHPGNGLSPATPMILIVALIYLWAFAHLRRLSAVSGKCIEASLQPFGMLTGQAINGPAKALRQFIDGAVQKLPPPLTALVFAAGLIAAYLVWLHPLASPEPVWFTFAFRAAWLLLQILLWLAFAHVAYFWYTLQQAMHAFAGTPMVGAFKRLSPDFFHDRLSPRQPDDADLKRMTHTAGQLGLALASATKDNEATHRELVHVLRNGFPCTAATESRGREAWAYSPEWVNLSRVVPMVIEVVADAWATRPRPTALSTIDFDADATDKDIKDDMQRWLLRAEEFLAMHVLLVVRELLSRLANVFFYVIVAVMLMVAVQQSFPFQPRQELLGMAWIYVLCAVVLVLAIVVQMEHDDVLSAFASTKSGALSWDAALWAKVFMYGVIPLATVFAAQFPGIGSTLLDWLTPVQKALP